TNSPSTFFFAKSWLEVCTAHHNECWREKRQLFPQKNHFLLPTRIIDIGSGPDISPRLRYSVDISGQPHYLTLSHCWGDGIPTRLLQSNESAMKQSIIFCTLSQTFQDALVVTKALGLQYIWIDALCIIQDSEDDWQIESAQMCDIYSNSFCNIAATASIDGSEGLFRQRDYGHSIKPISVRVGNKAHKIVDSELWKREIEKAPLIRRAWVCQELTLAPRTIHFGSTQVFSECSRLTCSESFPLGFPSCVDANSRRALHRNLESIRKHGLGSPSKDILRSAEIQVELFQVWTTIVDLYSKGDLTYETDKLVAIGGIAAEIYHYLRIDYFAGLWRHDFARQLLWQSHNGRLNHASRPKNYIAPSWSWASITRGVTYSSQETFRLAAVQDLVKVRNIAVELEGANLFGQVKGGAAYLEGKLFRLRFGSSALDCEITGLDKCWAEVWVGAGCFVKVWLTISRDISWIGGVEIPWRHDDLYCLPIQSGPVYSRRVEPLMRGLLLERIEVTGEFQRHGTFSVIGNVSVDVFQAGLRAFDERARESGLQYVDDGNGGRNYLIRII
ncbi:HET-domain-containing protein, partial [Stipitochalara longipes BDJ]